MIWLLRGQNMVSKRQNESERFQPFSPSDTPLRHSCAQPSVCTLHKSISAPAHVTKEPRAVVNHALHLSRTPLRDISAHNYARCRHTWKTKIPSNFPPKLSALVTPYEKQYANPIPLLRHFDPFDFSSILNLVTSYPLGGLYFFNEMLSFFQYTQNNRNEFTLLK